MTSPEQHRTFDGSAIPGRIVSGPGSRSAIESELERLAVRRVLIITGANLRAATPFVGELEDRLGRRIVAVFDGVRGHTPDDSLEKAAAFARELRPDAVLSIGGGSAHDTAKAVAVMVPSGRHIADFVSRFEPPDRFFAPDVDVDPLPVLTVPSTFSAAEVVGGGAFTERATGRKLIFVHPRLTPNVVVLDGEVAATTPRATLLASGMNALHHCMEALYSRGRQPVTDAFALRAAGVLSAVLPRLAPEVATAAVGDVQTALEAAALSGLTYANSWLGIGHAICHVLGGRYGVPHGEANAVMIRHSLRFNREHASDRLALVAQAAGARFPDGQEDLAAGYTIALVDWLAERLEMPRRLRELGLDEGALQTVVDEALVDPQAYWNPRPVTAAELLQLLRAAW